MLQQFKINPFSRQALKNDDLLSGQKHQECLKNIRRVFNYSIYLSNLSSIIIRGDRGTGKTSLLKILFADSEKYNLVATPLFLTENINNSAILFFENLYSSLFSVCKNNSVLIDEINNAEYYLTRRENPTSLEYCSFEFYNKLIGYYINPSYEFNVLPSDIKNDLELIVNQFRRKDEKHKIVFFIDEAHHIYSNPEILNAIRHIIQEEIGVSFIFASMHPVDDSIINNVFDSIERGFKIFDLNTFETLYDVDQFFRKSLTNVGWKERDFKNCIKDYDKLIINIFRLTNGKPEFINRIAEQMFDSVMLGEETKLKWSQKLLNKISTDLEKQTGDIFESSDLFGFDRSRIDYIKNLNLREFTWLKYLIASARTHNAKSVFNYLHFLFDEPYEIEFEFLKNLLVEFQKHKILIFESDLKKLKGTKVGYEINQITELIHQRSLYYGSDSEKYFLQIMLQVSLVRSINFSVKPPLVTLIEEITNFAGFQGKFRLTASKQVKSNSEIESDKFDLLHLLNLIKSKSKDYDIFDEGVISFIFDMISSDINNYEIFSFTLVIENTIHKTFSYKEKDYINVGDINRLESIKKKFETENISFLYSASSIEKSNIISVEEFIDFVASSKQSSAAQSIYIKACDLAQEKYLEDKETRIKNEPKIKNLINYILIGIESGSEINIRNINSAGYMYLNIGEIESSLRCFKYVVDKYNNGYYNDIIDEETKSGLALVYYNYGICLALNHNYKYSIECFEKAIDLISSTGSSFYVALNILQNNDNTLTIQEYRKDIDFVEFIQKNIETLNVYEDK